ncbi:MAG: Rieske (2Fe-2S) protein [Gammaproteobacteria bacterium]
MTRAPIGDVRWPWASWKGTTVTCPCHGSQFDVTSGAVLRGPAARPVRSRPAQIKEDELLVES